MTILTILLGSMGILLASMGIFWMLFAATVTKEKKTGRCAFKLVDGDGEAGSDSESEPSIAESDDQELPDDDDAEEYDAEGFFCDRVFPPGVEALGNIKGDSANKAKGKIDEWQDGMLPGWARPHQMAGENRTQKHELYELKEVEPRLFGHTSPNDLRQGHIGDCWLIAAMSSIAVFPSLVQRLFKQQELAEDGRYDIRLYDEETERWHVVTIDDRLPFKKKPGIHGRLLFCKPSLEGEFWPCLLEKAFAKWLDGYWRLEGGFIGVALIALTGKPSVYLSIGLEGAMHESYDYVYGPKEDSAAHKCLLMRNPGKDKKWFTWKSSSLQAAWDMMGEEAIEETDDDGLWEKLKTWDSQGYIMGCASRCNYQGVRKLHAYSFFCVVEVEVEGHDDYSSLRLVKIRNPHAGNEWTGPFSDANEESWNAHPEALAACDHEVVAKEDGNFWMPFHEFKQGFNRFHLNLQARKTEEGGAELLRFDQIEAGHAFSEDELAVRGHVWDMSPADDDEDSDAEITAATGEGDEEVMARIEALMADLKTQRAQLQDMPPGDERKALIMSIGRKGRRLAAASDPTPPPYM